MAELTNMDFSPQIAISSEAGSKSSKLESSRTQSASF